MVVVTEPQPSSDESVVEPPRRRVPVRRIVLVLGLVLLAVLYVLGLFAYKQTDGSYTVNGEPAQITDGLQIVALPTTLSPATNELTVRLLVEPVGAFSDEAGFPTQDLQILVDAYGGSSTITLKKGEPVSPQEVRVYADGRWSQYPLDKYVGELTLIATTKELDLVPTSVSASAGLEGWALEVDLPETSADGVSTATMTLSRPFATSAFVALILVLFAFIAITALTIAYVVSSSRRRIEPALLGWGAALMFALPALRNALPGAPPIGAWIDVAVFLWVVALVIFAYLIVLSTWVRKSPPPAG